VNATAKLPAADGRKNRNLHAVRQGRRQSARRARFTFSDKYIHVFPDFPLLRQNTIPKAGMSGE
jgi:hypothetical protein